MLLLMLLLLLLSVVNKQPLDSLVLLPLDWHSKTSSEVGNGFFLKATVGCQLKEPLNKASLIRRLGAKRLVAVTEALSVGPMGVGT